MARDMSNTYRWMTIYDLEELKSRKLMHLRRLENKYLGYFDLQEARRVRYNIGQIEAEIACKSAQLELL